MHEPRQRARHVAEAVIEGDGDADPVRLVMSWWSNTVFVSAVSHLLIVSYSVADVMGIVH